GNHTAVGANLHLAVELAAVYLRVEAPEAIGDDPADPQVLPGADGHDARVGVDIRDIAWAAVQGFARQAKGLALTNGETVHAVVLRHGLPAGIPHQAGTQADLRAQECLSSAIRDEADVVAIWLIGDPEAGVGGLLADLGLDRVPDREHTVCELFVGEHAEDIRLVLVRVHSTAQHAIVELRVVAGDHGVEAQRDGAVQQGLELDLLVAAQARIRGLADGVGVHEVIDHIGLEAVGEVPD